MNLIYFGGIQLAMLHLFISFSTLGNAKLAGLVFERVPSGNISLGVYATQSNIKNHGQCALWCIDKRSESPVCQAFRFNLLDRKCELYSNAATEIPSPDVLLFNPVMTDVFHRVYQDGELYSIYLSSAPMPHLKALENCNLLGGYLLHLDSLGKYEAVREIISGHSASFFYVGAKDADGQDHWVAEKDGLPLDVNTWLWAKRQPEKGGYERCSAINKDNVRLHDIVCWSVLPYLCEKAS